MKQKERFRENFSESPCFSCGELQGELYRQFAYRTNSNPRICAQNRGMANLDYIETEGQIEVLESVAMEIFA